jgi:hypothetical protein
MAAALELFSERLTNEGSMGHIELYWVIWNMILDLVKSTIPMSSKR